MLRASARPSAGSRRRSNVIGFAGSSHAAPDIVFFKTIVPRWRPKFRLRKGWVMRLAKLAGVVAGIFSALALGGCIPTYQAASGVPAVMSRSTQLATMYGGGATSFAETRRSAVAMNPRTAPDRPSADTALIYSAEWRKREAEREARLKQATAICRC
jgi:hypothetical protein